MTLPQERLIPILATIQMLKLRAIALLLAFHPVGISAQETGQSNKRLTPAELREQSKPGPEHQMLAEFAGRWKLSVSAQGKRGVSTGSARSYMTLENRFLWLGYDAKGKAGNFKGAFTIGFDRRHSEFTLIAMDTDGTYFVTSRGKRASGAKTIKLTGKDDDPHMKALGFEKEFAHVLDLSGKDSFSIKVLYIDNRTDERKEIEALEFKFERQPKPPSTDRSQ